MSERLPHWLRRTRQLLTLTRHEEILGTASREALELTGAHRVYASAVSTTQIWERGRHVVTTAERSEPVASAERSALFAVYRALAKGRVATTLTRSAHAVVYRSLTSSASDVVEAVPLVHRTGRLCGALVLVGAAPDRGSEDLATLLELVAMALENAERFSFARRDQDRLLLLAEATDDALYDWELEGDVWWGGGIVQLLGSGAEPLEPSARWKAERVHPEERERFAGALAAALADPKESRWRSEFRFRRQDGSHIVVEDRGYILRDLAGRAQRMIGSLRDMTPVKTLLAREREARAEAENATRAKDEFLALLGHELRNPLAPIITGLELVRARDGGAFARELDVIERQSQRLVRLVDDLLDISRIANKKITLKLERLEVVDVVELGVEAARPLIESQRHTLVIDVPQSGLEVTADRDRLAQVIANLLTNAAKYTEPCGTITISATSTGEGIQITVRDTGTGIDAEMLPNVFNMFVQERQALDRAQGGLGLGLSIVRSLVELHGGAVSATSEGRGRGSAFTITLPSADPMSPPRSRRAEPPRGLRRGGNHILVVDDNEEAAELLGMLLENLGNAICIAHHADEALEVLEDFSPTLAVLDIGLPGVDGYQLARLIRQRFGRAIGLIALTGYGQPSDRERAAEAGFDAHLVKPVNLEALEAAIEKVSAAGAP